MGDENIFEIFPWNKNFETGIEQIDEQHKKLVDILNHLAVHLASRSDEIVLNEIFEQLAEYAHFHFRFEEKIWNEYFQDDEWREEHLHTHAHFMDEVLLIKKNENNKALDDVVYEIISFLAKWLANHILETDKRMAIAVINMQKGHDKATAKDLATRKMNGSLGVVVDAVLSMYDTLSTRTLDLMREKSLRLKAEEELRQSEEKLQLFIEHDAENIWDWDMVQDDIATSAPLEPLEYITGSYDNSKTRIHPDDIKSVRQDFQAHLEGKTEFYVNKHRLLKEDGSWSWILSRGKIVSRDSNGTATRMIGVHTDITEKELAKLIFQNTSQAIFITNIDNEIISINPAFTHITGYSKEEIMGKNPKILASGKKDTIFYDEMYKALESVGHWSGHILNKRKNGEIFTEYLEISRVMNEEGNVDYHYALLSDVTEFKEQEDLLVQQSRMAQMGELLSMIAHQWKQPLARIGVISSSVQLKHELKQFDLETEKGREAYSDFIVNSFVGIDSLVKGLSATMSDFTNLYNPNILKEELPFSTPVAKALEIIKKSLLEDGVSLIEEYDDSGLVEIHNNEMMQVVLNILKNAQDNFREKKIEKPTLKIRTYTSDTAVVLEISDNGGGIQEDIINSVFSKYFSTKSRETGSGIGLYMSKLIVESHNSGKLYAKNSGEGVCFVIEIPK